MIRVAFQGERGEYSEAAAISYFGETLEPIRCVTFDDVFVGVEAGKVERGIIQIKNSLGGSIHSNYVSGLRASLTLLDARLMLRAEIFGSDLRLRG